MNIIFATSNAHKVEEIRAVLPPGFTVQSLKDIGFTEELPETQATIEGNSLQKAQTLSEKLNGVTCFSEDTGLEIDALDGRPGVYSARYAGPSATFADNVAKVLAEMAGQADRRARFKTVITYYTHGRSVQFTGLCEGTILSTPRGTEGFGYDPIFIPEGCNLSFAEMRLEDKNQISHRRRAVDQFLAYLKRSG
ncbi:MAG: RdgB/HAM1 family non-canonical purine NTP pyrophosphatase [Bacteroidetes bacterium]|nr:RdgB/HAM1 family non-canonical purine NTP pyrophosphatase [Bacteroidota bacterium]MBS1684584.1 RdgB/HAM1 family non-canonical purine NTP pyrophosphatase [Bacteroidota bacterium]